MQSFCVESCARDASVELLSKAICLALCLHCRILSLNMTSEGGVQNLAMGLAPSLMKKPLPKFRPLNLKAAEWSFGKSAVNFCLARARLYAMISSNDVPSFQMGRLDMPGKQSPVISRAHQRCLMSKSLLKVVLVVAP